MRAERVLRAALRRRRLKPIHSAYVYWSMYVRTSNKRKLLESHLPPIKEALERLDFDWQILREPENPGEYRLVTYQNLEGASVDAVIAPVLRRAYHLADGWKIAGLGDLSEARLRHVRGYWRLQGALGSAPPASCSRSSRAVCWARRKRATALGSTGRNSPRMKSPI